ncbi:crotonase/enoyl-CoA hydratase family protein [Pseudofrankia asymbiotica]|uniref:Enoyl-CoA hydratase n=1 Tax=Pseudofrankia asymbiotica TaxID=1834516 RepID=A0A1V2IEW1_9ACTN|nr:crotonase/enoyl-CoA hydratase family protein [Pseudofrankia asymbiotica]ONH31733.1 enoyl-CoA hydratase [Pseudofrankia asymbiotica]
MSDVVLTEKRDRVLLITINRPAARNAIDNDVADGLLAAQRQLDEDRDLSVGVLCGAGGAFCSGMDLKAFARVGFPKALAAVLFESTTKPVIAAVEGYAFAGGLELALSCDIVVAARDAVFAVAEAKVGLVAIGGALIRLPRTMPYGQVMEMALTGDPISAQDAHRHGLVTRLTEPGESVPAALELAARIARNAPLSLAATKRLVQDAQGRTEPEFWEHQKAVARPALRSKDAKEGPRAFAEKRDPQWSGE